MKMGGTVGLWGVAELFNIQANGRDLAELNSKGRVILNGNSFYT